MPEAPLVELKNIGKCFEADWLFRHVSFKIQEHTTAVLMGPSGSGKSVLLKIIAQLIEPSEGSFKLGTEDLGMLFQKNALFDSLTVEENLLFPLKERKGESGPRARKKAHRFLRKVELTGSEELYPSEISGGMQKRLGIARALIVEPKLLLYDEPTAGLDPITSKTIADLILHFQKDFQTTIAMVTNDIQRAYQLGDTLFLLAKGELKYGGFPSEVQHTDDPAFRQFIYGIQQGPLTEQLSS